MAGLHGIYPTYQYIRWGSELDPLWHTRHEFDPGRPRQTHAHMRPKLGRLPIGPRPHRERCLFCSVLVALPLLRRGASMLDTYCVRNCDYDMYEVLAMTCTHRADTLRAPVCSLSGMQWCSLHVADE
jgi:hypothetical protein